MTLVSRGRRRSDDAAPVAPQSATLRVSWPWWLHPAWALALLTGATALVAVALPTEVYLTWGVPKFLDQDSSLLLLVCATALFVGILSVSLAASRGGTVDILMNPKQIHWLRMLFACLFILTVLGYVFWILIAIAQGVRLDSLMSVLQREAGAISTLKADSRPVGGVTTLTQFGPVAIVIGFILRKIGHGGSGFYWMIPLAGLRYVFYAERLALIEVLVPLLVIAALTTDPRTRRGVFVRLAPIFGVPALWALFAVSEYSRSWIFYEQNTAMGFPAWVSLRLLGYYTTSFNNSALFFSQTQSTEVVPYFSLSGFWNAPGIEQLLPHPGFGGIAPEQWWAGALSFLSNPEFTNAGSFLVVAGEFGPLLAIAYWLLVGAIAGAAFRAMTQGSVPALIANATLFISILELPRIMYWSLGRATPILIGIVLLALWYPRGSRGQRNRPKFASVTTAAGSAPESLRPG